MKKLSIGLLSAALIAAVTFCVSGCSRKSGSLITLAGSTAFQPFAEKLAEKYMEMDKEIRINVQGGGSAVGIQSAVSGAADIGMADLLELPAEAKTLHSTVVAKDGIAIIVNPKNPANNMTSEQAHDVFSGKIRNWKDLGGPDAAIDVVSREDGSGTRATFDQLILGKDRLVPGALFQNSNGTVRETVAQDEKAIGYISISLISGKIKALSLDGITPTNKNVKEDTYRLSRPVFLLTKGAPSGNVEKFVNYVLSPESQNILEKEGLIAVK